MNIRNFFKKENKEAEMKETEVNVSDKNETNLDTEEENESNEVQVKLIDNTDLEKEKEVVEETPAYIRYKNIDWRKISPQKILFVNSEIMLENKRLIQEKMQIKLYADELEKQNLTVNSLKRELNKILDDIAGQLFSCSELLTRINDGEKLSIRQKADAIVKSVLKSEKDLMEENKELYEKTKEYKIVLNNLQQQVYELTVEKQSEYASESQRYTEEDIKEMINITPTSQDIIITATPLSKINDSVRKDDVAIAILEVIGKQGLSEFPEILKVLIEKGVNDNKVEESVQSLISDKVITSENCKPFNRSSGVRLLELTKDIGVKVYKELFTSEPVESEMSMIIKENDNTYHGYSIKDVYLQLLARGYKKEDVSMRRKANTITISNGVTWIPDVIAKHPISNVTEYYEVETGKCNQKDFYYKLDKACLVTNKLRIIVPNKGVADDYFENIKSWYASKQIKPAMTSIVYTFKEFKDKQKEKARCYPKPQKEDINVSNEIFNEIKKKGGK